MNLIGWCDITKNYVWGCTNGCKYCYARKIAKRFSREMANHEFNFWCGNNWKYSNRLIKNNISLRNRLYNFKPTLLSYKFAQSLPKKPQRIFLDSMSDIADWKPNWYEKILKKVCENMQHTFIILTKRPAVYRKYTFPHNVWLGVSMCTYHDWVSNNGMIDLIQENKNKLFISFEPVQNQFSNRFLEMLEEKFDWIIVGPETGKRKNKIIATKKMIQPFYAVNIPVYMKSSCSKIIDTPLRQEWPE